jgi:hypothetical protein
MLTLYDMARTTGICTAIWWTVQSGHVDQMSTWGSGVAAAALSIGAAWGATIATKKIASMSGEGVLLGAYLGTFVVTAVAGATGGAVCHRLLDSI